MPAMRPLLTLLSAALLASLLPAPGALGAQDPGQELALVQQIRLADGGRGLFAERTGVEELLTLDMGDLLNDGDDAYTLEGTRAAIRFTDDQSLVRMNENTVLRIRAEGEDRGSLRRIIELEGGELWARITGRPGTETQVRTPSGVAAVRGTDFIVRYDQETGEVTVITLEGLLEFFNEAGSVEVPAGQTGRAASQNDAPEVRPTQPEDLAPSQALLQDQAESENGEFSELLIIGADGREIRILLGRDGALELLRDGGGP